MDFEVRKTGRTFAIYCVTETKAELVEGGFFSRAAAERTAREYLNDAVEQAEAKAGWPTLFRSRGRLQ